MTFACAIAPLDQSTTTLGWRPGIYQYTTPHVDGAAFVDYSLQFMADPGTPVVAPFPVRIVATRANGLNIRPTVELPYLGGQDYAYDIFIQDVTPAAPVGTVLQKGDLLGRIAPGARSTKWVLWGSSSSTPPEQRNGITALFQNLGLEIVGGDHPNLPAYRSTPPFGGRLLARARGLADCSTPGSGGLGGLGRLGSAPDGYVETPSSVYSRFGTSKQTDTSIPNPHSNVPTVAQAAGGGGFALLGLGLLGWWLSRK